MHFKFLKQNQHECAGSGGVGGVGGGQLPCISAPSLPSAAALRDDPTSSLPALPSCLRPVKGGLQLRAAAPSLGLAPPRRTRRRADVVLVRSLPVAESGESEGSRGGGGGSVGGGIIFAANCSPRSS